MPEIPRFYGIIIAINLIYEWMDLHKDELLENWRLIEQRKSLNKIEPLK